MLKKIYLGLFIISSFAFSEDIDDLYNSGLVKYKGIDVLNFYIPVEEKNRFYTSIDYEIKNDKNIYQWKMAEGYLEINNLWDFEYNIEKEFHKQKKDERKKYYGWDNKFTFVKTLKIADIAEKEWNNSLILGLEQSQIDDKGFEVERYKLFAGYRMRTSLNIGKGGTYFGFDFIGKKVLSKEKDGWSAEFNIISSTNMGYGFQLFNTVYNEFLYYDNYEGTYRFGLESFLRWTYELNNNWAFSIDTGIDTDKYFKNTTDDYNLELYIYPHFLFSYNLNPELRIIGEIGLPSYKFTRDEAADYKNFKDQIYFYSKIGIEYIF